MTIAFETTAKAQGELIAALHQGDLTVRPQVVIKEANPHYFDLISEFNKLTGVAGLLNTSFNIHGEPMILTPKDAFDVFERTNLDALLFETHLVEKQNSDKTKLSKKHA